jgi:hypothetical protein
VFSCHFEQEGEMQLTYQALPTDQARALQRGGVDAYGHPPERGVSDGVGIPCRHCMKIVPAGQEYLSLSYRPFPVPQPYAEQGPIFLCANECHRASEEELPVFLTSDSYVLRGYSATDRIVYGSAAVVATTAIPEAASSLLARDDIAYLHVRSVTNNCYHMRIEGRETG